MGKILVHGLSDGYLGSLHDDSLSFTIILYVFSVPALIQTSI